MAVSKAKITSAAKDRGAGLGKAGSTYSVMAPFQPPVPAWASKTSTLPSPSNENALKGPAQAAPGVRSYRHDGWTSVSSTLILPPTSSVELAQKALRDIPVGGKTSLMAGLTLTYHVIMRELRLRPEVLPLMIILTDGAGNVSMSNLPPQVEAYQMANQIAEEKIRSIVINMEHVAFDQGLARKLAENLEGVCLSLSELKAESLTKVVKAAL